MDKLEFDNFEVQASDLNDQQQNDDARISQEQNAIEYSSKVMAALEQKAKEHNELGRSKVNRVQLKKVFRRGASANVENKGLCAMARVNMFLRMKREGKITYQEAQAAESSDCFTCAHISAAVFAEVVAAITSLNFARSV